MALCGFVGLGATPPASAAAPAPSVQQQQAGQAWYQGVIGDLTPLQSSLISGLQAASKWQSRQEAAGTARGVMTTDGSALALALGSVEHLAPLAGYPDALANFISGLHLYVEAFALEAAATELPGGRLVAQLQQSFLRVRELGDVVFDQGTAQLAPLLGSTLAGPDVVAASHVPDWVALHLAPKPPLESSWSGTRAQPSASQSLAKWRKAVDRVAAPSDAVVRRTLARSSATGLAQLARMLQVAEVHLSSVPAPRGSQASALFRLGLLVDAEAALAAEAGQRAGAVRAGSFTTLASSLVAIGAGLRTAAVTGEPEGAS